MLLAFAEKTLSGLVFSALIVGTASYFGQAEIFDPIILLSFIAIALAFRRNVDLVSICSIFIAERGMEELMWRFLGDTIWFKIPCYLIFLLIPIFLASGPLRSALTFFVLTGIGVEIYWWATEYPAPDLVWGFYLLSIGVITRKVLRMRVFWLIELRPTLEPKVLPLDSQLLIANAISIGLVCLMISEYWLRHIFDIPDLLYVHSAFPYIAHIVSIFIVYMLVVQSIQHLQSLELNA